MTIMTIRIPDEVAQAFDKAYEGEDKDAVIAQLIRDCRLKRRREPRRKRKKRPGRRREAVDAILALRKQPPYFSDAEIKQAREEGRP